MRKIVLMACVLALAGCNESEGASQGKETPKLESDGMVAFQVVDLLRSGGSIRVSADKFVAFQLKDMAAAAASGGGRLIVVGWKEHLVQFQMEEISRNGPGHVEFE